MYKVKITNDMQKYKRIRNVKEIKMLLFRSCISFVKTNYKITNNIYQNTFGAKESPHKLI
jgi:hypothetical protein